MCRSIGWLASACVVLAAGPVIAQGPGGAAVKPDPEMKQKILDAFDTNDDGELDHGERRAIRSAMVEFFPPPERGRRGPRGDRRNADRSDRHDRHRAERARRQGESDRGERHAGRGRGPDRLFHRFDKNEDDQLSRDEFHKMSRFMHERFGPPQWRRGRRGPDGPPPGRGEARRPPRHDPSPPHDGGLAPAADPGPPEKAE